MYKTLFLSIFLFFTIATYGVQKTAQFQITGQVTDSTSGKAIPYTTITLLSDSNKVITKVCSEATGKFTINSNQKRAFKLIFTAIGYTETKVSGKIEETKTDVGSIKMKSGVALKEFGITAQKPLIKVDVDKITYNIESDPDSKTNNALEMLRKVPMLTVDGDENVTLNGQSNYKVLVNGKSSSMMSKNFKDVIKSLPASSIKDIEVITNPSSKYEAEGIGGIINIITIKKTLNGYNGSANAGFDSFGAANAGLYLTGKVNKFGFSGRYSINQNKNPESRSVSTRENYLPTAENQYYMNSTNTGKSGGFSQNFNGEASYDIDSLNLISASFWGYTGNNSNKGLSKTEILNSAKVRTSYYEMANNGTYNYGTVSGNIDYQKTYKKPDKTFTVSYKLDNNPNSQNYISETQNTVNYDVYKQNSVSESFTREQTLQADYYDPLSKKHQIECGVKGIYRQNYSNSDYFLLNNTTNEMVLDPAKSNELDYNQTIVGLYGGYVYKLDKFSMKSGLRAELTWNNAVSRSVTDTSFSSNLKNIVPYITFTYKLKPTQTFKLSYTQRLQRPSIWYLNPYRNESSRHFVYYGNPNLESEVAHSFEIGYNSFTPKFNFGLTGTTAFTKNSIEQIQFIDANNVQNLTFDNIGEDTRVGLNTYISYRPNSKLNIGFNGGTNYSRLEAVSMNRVIKNDGFNFRGSLNARLTLWKDAAVNANAGYYSSSVQLQGKSSGYNHSSIGLSQYFLKKKMSLNLSISNPFTKETIYRNSSSSVDFKYDSEYIRQSRSIRLNLSYNFGKMDISVKKAKRGIQNDDMKGGGGGSN